MFNYAPYVGDKCYHFDFLNIFIEGNCGLLVTKRELYKLRKYFCLQEQIALTEYNRALELLRDDKTKSAMTVFQDLLETELLDSVEKPETPDGRARPLLSLKYSCYKNIAMIQAKLENFVEAIDNYCAAACLDDSDVTLWLKIGCLAMKTLNLELACNAFKQGLKCNPNHWPSLDNLITCLYAVPDYMNCLLYISIALEQDPSYVKGLAFRSNIFKSIPDFEEYYKVILIKVIY